MGTGMRMGREFGDGIDTGAKGVCVWGVGENKVNYRRGRDIYIERERVRKRDR